MLEELRTMRLIQFLFLALVLGCSSEPPVESEEMNSAENSIAGATDEDLFHELSDTSLLGRLFDDPIFDSSGMALWKPNYYERMSFRVSYDGLCHTNIDTIMYWTDREKRRCACVVLATHKFRKGNVLDSTVVEVSDCHFCGVALGIVLLAQQPDSSWKLYRFEKAFTTLGYFGTYRTGRQDAGSIALKKIGDPWTCISLKEGVGGNGGESTGYENLYSIEQFQLSGFPDRTLSTIFGYDYYHEEEVYGDSGIVGEWEQRTAMHILEKPGEYYDIELLRDSAGHTSIRRYAYSDEVDQYQLK